ncbi:hypothetical protein Mal15_37310 [Stieleria maiorica]|uniref:Nitroreductase domain-containing protein n=2 Tax=Stieleria maiorica TaxID=2795974 RepID=A0A5B9MJ80_9BACT|nr:hypothetical protein Mal15_37310 [Stieleria maiorica]
MDSCDVVDVLLEAASLAPSGDNTQPWKFSVDRERRSIVLDIVPARDPSPMNAGQGMSRMALGAALENMSRTAAFNRWDYRVEPLEFEGLVRFTVERATSEPGTIEDVVRRRVTNRRAYQQMTLPPDCLQRLCEVGQSVQNAKVCLLTDPSLLGELVDLISRADAIMLGTKSVRNGFLSKVRFDRPIHEPVEEGLSLGSLEVALADRIALRVLKSLSPSDSLVKLFGGRRAFSRVAKRLAGSASGFLLVCSTGDGGEQSDVDVGRAWQKMWLGFTEEGLAAQPMMSLLVLQNMLRNAPGEFSQPDRQTAEKLVNQFNAVVASSGASEETVAAMMRFGKASPPTSRVGRLPSGQRAE